MPFKTSAPFTKCITKIVWTTIDDAEDLDLVMPIYNLIKCSSKYFDTKGSIWFYSKDEAINFNFNFINNDVFKSFKYKAKLLRDTVAQPAPNAANGILENAVISLQLSK